MGALARTRRDVPRMCHPVLGCDEEEPAAWRGPARRSFPRGRVELSGRPLPRSSALRVRCLEKRGCSTFPPRCVGAVVGAVVRPVLELEVRSVSDCGLARSPPTMKRRGSRSTLWKCQLWRCRHCWCVRQQTRTATPPCSDGPHQRLAFLRTLLTLRFPCPCWAAEIAELARSQADGRALRLAARRPAPRAGPAVQPAGSTETATSPVTSTACCGASHAPLPMNLRL